MSSSKSFSSSESSKCWKDWNMDWYIKVSTYNVVEPIFTDRTHDHLSICFRSIFLSRVTGLTETPFVKKGVSILVILINRILVRLKRCNQFLCSQDGNKPLTCILAWTSYFHNHKWIVDEYKALPVRDHRGTLDCKRNKPQQVHSFHYNT